MPCWKIEASLVLQDNKLNIFFEIKIIENPCMLLLNFLEFSIWVCFGTRKCTDFTGKTGFTSKSGKQANFWPRYQIY